MIMASLIRGGWSGYLLVVLAAVMSPAGVGLQPVFIDADSTSYKLALAEATATIPVCRQAGLTYA